MDDFSLCLVEIAALDREWFIYRNSIRSVDDHCPLSAWAADRVDANARPCFYGEAADMLGIDKALAVEIAGCADIFDHRRREEMEIALGLKETR